jgi:NAD(P)-dependent dehydrogenase (short-subunit alcohol dehydrogenase family)
MFCSLQSKRILITGASSGIGQASAHLVASRGGIPILLGRSVDRLEETKNWIIEKGLSCGEIISDDLSTETAIDLAVAKISAPVDGAVFSAGISKPMPLQMAGYEYLLQTLSINTLSPFVMLGKLQKKRLLNLKSSVIFLSSIAAITGTKGTFAYAASKGALNGAIRALSDELAKKQMRVNVVSPAVVKTNIWTEEQDVYLEAQAKKYPLGLASAEDIAATIVFLLSESSMTITGENIVIDSGCTNIS